MIPMLYKRLLQIGKVSTAIAFLVAAPYALFKYWEAQEEARVSQTLAMYKLYNGSPFTGYREKITKALVKHRDKLNSAAVKPDELTTAQLEMIKQEDIEMELLLVLDFFDGLTICVVSKVCDDNTAVLLFKPRARDIYLNFYRYMLVHRTAANTNEFGWGLEVVARTKL